MTEWITPKIDWKVIYDDETGEYVGDYFNLEDYNRLQNNMNVLYERCKLLYPSNQLYTPPRVDVSEYDMITADYFVIIADPLDMYCVVGAHIPFEDYLYFKYIYNYDKFPNYEKLNSLEKTMLRCYETMNLYLAERRQFKWRLGIEGGTKKWV